MYDVNKTFFLMGGEAIYPLGLRLRNPHTVSRSTRSGRPLAIEDHSGGGLPHPRHMWSIL